MIYQYYKLGLYFIFILVFLSVSSIILVGQQSAFDTTLVSYKGDVYFDSGKFDLRPLEDTTLQALVQKSINVKDYVINIEAYTDSIGSLASNEILSSQRANTIKKWLLSHGIIDVASIHIAHWGEDKPVADNTSETGRQLNRRATLRLYQRIPMTTIEGTLVDQETGTPIQGSIVIHTKEVRDSFLTLSNGKFSRLVPDETIMGIDVYAKGYFFDTKMIKTSESRNEFLEFLLPPAKLGAVVDINNLYYYGNQDVLLPASRPELPKILKFMELNDGLKIEIGGHINHPNSPPVLKNSWNYDLSVRRAKMVRDYLIEHKIDSTRIEYQGYGNYEMRFPNATTENEQAKNRRVQIKIKG